MEIVMNLYSIITDIVVRGLEVIVLFVGLPLGLLTILGLFIGKA